MAHRVVVAVNDLETLFTTSLYRSALEILEECIDTLEIAGTNGQKGYRLPDLGMGDEETQTFEQALIGAEVVIPVGKHHPRATHWCAQIDKEFFRRFVSYGMQIHEEHIETVVTIVPTEQVATPETETSTTEDTRVEEDKAVVAEVTDAAEEETQEGAIQVPSEIEPPPFITDKQRMLMCIQHVGEEWHQMTELPDPEKFGLKNSSSLRGWCLDTLYYHPNGKLKEWVEEKGYSRSKRRRFIFAQMPDSLRAEVGLPTTPAPQPTPIIVVPPLPKVGTREWMEWADARIDTIDKQVVVEHEEILLLEARVQELRADIQRLQTEREGIATELQVQRDIERQMQAKVQADELISGLDPLVLEALRRRLLKDAE